MASDRVRQVKAILDQLAERAGFGGEPTPNAQILREEAIGHFITGGAELLDEATPFIWAYYRTTAAGFAPEEWARCGIPQIPDSAEIWEHVHFQHPPEWQPGDGPLTPGRSYLSFEGEAAWEPEHGLQLVYEHGQRVCKVSPYDGHATLAHAYGDPSLLGVIFG